MRRAPPGDPPQDRHLSHPQGGDRPPDGAGAVAGLAEDRAPLRPPQHHVVQDAGP